MHYNNEMKMEWRGTEMTEMEWSDVHYVKH